MSKRYYPVLGDCWICKARGEEIRLCGDYAVTLCAIHRNDWKEYAHGIPTINDYLRAAGTVDYYNRCMAGHMDVHEETYLDAQREAKEWSRKAFGIAKRWVAKAQAAWEKTHKEDD